MKPSKIFPDPSEVNQIDFYSSALKIRRLLRRMGYQDVVPMDGKVYGYMPKKYFDEWSDYKRRLLLVKKKGGKEFERYVAQILSQYYSNPATFSNKIKDLSPGGDYDILVEGKGEALFHFETKASTKDTDITPGVPDIWNFMVREAHLGSDMSVFLYDTNYKIQERMVPIFEILFSLAKYLEGKLEKPSSIDLEPWLKRVEKHSFEKLGVEIVKSRVYYLYWPVVVTAGGTKIKENIGETLTLYHAGIRYVSPYERLSRRPTRETFLKMPNWKDLPKLILSKVKGKDVVKWAIKSTKKTI